ncbi:aminotransferase class IV [Legionella fairfieldensis]|uniref:aminotransferase class IV n=1 Tax=Legionella fairfieldensis TaxID=45064 RepID=UPI000685AFC4|nr:aminotransferase class IV [Legionella fairfieldensis]
MRIIIQDSKGPSPYTTTDRIFLGEGLFETIKIVNGKPCYPEYHWQRLQKAAIFLKITFDLSLDVWLKKLGSCIASKQLRDGVLKAVLSAGSAPRGLLERGTQPHLVLTAFDYVHHDRQPLALVSASWVRDAKNPIYQYKSINYLEAIIARRQAQAAGADDVLFFNLEGQITETTVANLFIIKNNGLMTPPLHSGVLAGIIRQRLLTLCKAHDIDCAEHELYKDNLNEAEAAFTCNVVQGIRAIQSIDTHFFTSEHPLFEHVQTLLANDYQNPSLPE